MIQTKCAICDGNPPYTVLYPENIDFERIDEKIFSARRIPDRVHYRVVKCSKCRLVYSNPILEPGEIERLYKKSSFSYGEEAENIKKTYGHYLEKIEPYVADKGRLLEVGCGNGFFLETALELGYREVYGVEPSSEAAAKARDDIRPRITIDILKPGQFENGFFDVICFFQVLDHVPDPAGFLRLCNSYLKKDGVVLCIIHNTNSLQARVLGEKSPIIDVEHIFLFNEKTIRAILEKTNFTAVRTFPVWNVYTVNYLVRMMPIPAKIKFLKAKILAAVRLGGIRLKMPLGNLGAVAKKQG